MDKATDLEKTDWRGRLVRRHLLIGWSGLLLFLSLGIFLEALHGLKINYYLDTRNVTRRLMWTLGHAHGTLFSLIHVAFALSVARVGVASQRRVRMASNGLLGGLLFLPLGFFLGGLKFYEGDPGFGIFLVPVGAVLMFVGVGAFALEVSRGTVAKESPPGPGEGRGPQRSSGNKPRRS